MGRPKSDAPSATYSKGWRQWVIRLSGEDFPLGNGSIQEIQGRRTQALAAWYARGKMPRHHLAGQAVSVDELILRLIQHVQQRYANENRDPCNEIAAMRLAFKQLRRHHGSESAADFDVDKLSTLRALMSQETVKRGGKFVNVTRCWVNKRMSYITRLFKWGARRRLIDTTVYANLLTIERLGNSECDARVNPPVEPVSEDEVRATLPFLSPTVRDMVEIQFVTGMRSGELCQMSLAMIDRSQAPWRYTPAKRKTLRHGWNPPIILVESVQRIILARAAALGAGMPIFSPRTATAERNSIRRKHRKTKVQPSQSSRSQQIPLKCPGERYSTSSYYRAIQYAIKQAVAAGTLKKAWHPHQLRHTVARFYAQRAGVGAAQTQLGHKKIETTMRYVGYDERYAAEVAELFPDRGLST